MKCFLLVGILSLSGMVSAMNSNVWLHQDALGGPAAQDPNNTPYLGIFKEDPAEVGANLPRSVAPDTLEYLQEDN
jgi:hypothetical protein